MRQGQEGIDKKSPCGLDAQAIKQGLSPFWQDLAVQVHNSVSSTNDLAKEAARQGSVVLMAACQQTAGRGRRGRSFFSPAGSGLYFSLAFPWQKQESPVLLTTMAAVASAQVLEEALDLTIGIKWVNDLYYLKKKVAGILTEAVSREKTSFMVLGIGINLTPPPQGFPPDLARKAGSLIEQARDLDKGALLCRIVNKLGRIIQKLPDRTYLDDYRARSFILGKEVRLETGEIIIPHDISDQGGLLYWQGQDLMELDSGQVSLLDYPL